VPALETPVKVVEAAKASEADYFQQVLEVFFVTEYLGNYGNDDQGAETTDGSQEMPLNMKGLFLTAAHLVSEASCTRREDEQERGDGGHHCVLRLL
jgi:hypothetical protein